MLWVLSLLNLQGGNNIHSKGVSAIAETLKDNSVVTTVSHLILTFLVCTRR